MKSLSGWTLLVGAMSRCIFGVVFGSFSFLPVLAQQPLPTLLVDVDHRPVTSLDGPWHYLVDQSGRGFPGQNQIPDSKAYEVHTEEDCYAKVSGRNK